MMKKACITITMIMALSVWLVGVVGAATEGQKQTAIQNGLAWMAANQQADGSWNYGEPGSGNIAATGAALLAFMEQLEKPEGWFGEDYTAVVNKGYEHILNNAQAVNISIQPAADTNGNGIGLKFVLGGRNDRDTYVTGLVLPALAKRGNLDDVVLVGSQAGVTYRRVIQDTVDYFAFGQNDAGSGEGAWRYYANSGVSDNSTSQWPVVGMLYAESVGATIPAFVKTKMKIWIDYIQHSSGGSGYDSPSSYVNESKTGGLLLEMVFAGYDGYKEGDTLGKQEALDFLDSHWLNGPSGKWYGNFGHPYAMWGIYKGLQTTIGLGDTTEIANLHAAGPMDPGDTWNWWEDYCESLVNTQNGDGSWSGYSYWGPVLATPWNINILNATTIVPPVSIDIKPSSCPNPLNVKSGGVLPVAVLGTEDLDVTTIDPSSIILTREGVEEGVAPLRWAYEDVGTPFKGESCDCHELSGDGYLDLTLKFRTQELVQNLGLDQICGETIPLTLEGNLAGEDGVPITGEDCVWLHKEVCDNGIDDDNDGLVDAADADCAMAACTGTAEASMYNASNVHSQVGLCKHLAYLLLPVGAVIVLRIMRRKR